MVYICEFLANKEANMLLSEEFDNRLETRKPFDAYLNKYICDEPFMVRSADISKNGIYLHKLIEPNIPDGTMVSLEFMLPNSDEVLWVRGAVMREGSRWGTEGVGVWFTIVPNSYRKLIDAFITDN
jgi:hypothetical protein